MKRKGHLFVWSTVVITAIIIAIFLVPLVTASASGGEIPSSSANHDYSATELHLRAVQEYASYYKVSTDEAMRRFRLQGTIGKLNADLEQYEADTFAGLWVQHTPDYQIRVSFTQNGGKAIHRYLDNSEYQEIADSVVIQPADISLVQMSAVQEETMKMAKGLGIDVNSEGDVENNDIVLYVTDRAKLGTALQMAGKSLPEHVRIVETKELTVDDVNIYGGLQFCGSMCGTTGFTVRNIYSGVKGVLTAGHMPNTTMTCNGASLPYIYEQNGGAYDVQWHSASGQSVLNIIQISEYGQTETITATKSRYQQYTGEIVEKYGNTTHWGWGIIESKTWNPGGIYNSSTYIRVHNPYGTLLSAGGDSGGPWIGSYATPNTAYGINKGHHNSDGIYMAIDYASAIGVSVLTSP